MTTPSLQLQVDELILDYLLWHCIETLLDERQQLRTNPGFSPQAGDLAIKLARSTTPPPPRLHLRMYAI